MIYYIAFRYEKPRASLLNVKAVRQSFGWSVRGRLSDRAQV